MLDKRLIVSILLVPSIVLFIYLGGLPLAAATAALSVIGVWEIWRIYKKGGYDPGLYLMIAGVVLLVIARYLAGVQYDGIVITIIIIAAATYHLLRYESGIKTSAIDMVITIGWTIYLGYMGAYVLSLRSLQDGMWWLLLVLPAANLADGGAYVIGKWKGRHQIAPKISPKKTWEGYFGGIGFAALFNSGFAALWHFRAPLITWEKGLIIGLVISATVILGDLTISMLKRQFGVKDSSNILPGHGGIMDRFDTYLWALPIGYYLVTILWG